MKLALRLTVLPVLAAYVSAQATIHVPGDAPSIQIGIAIAQDGDTVLVSDGVYHERIDLLGRAITLKSVYGPHETFIDATGLTEGWITGAGSHRVVRAISGEGPDTVLSGFSITGSHHDCSPSTDSGGVRCGNITIRDCEIFGNDADRGGGVYGSPLMEDCRIYDNSSDDLGGGIYGCPVLVRCTVEGNSSEGGCGEDGSAGGGVFCYSGTLIQDCVIQDNTAGGGYEGGGVFGPATILNSIIVGNSVDDWGGIYRAEGGGLYGASLVQNCTVAFNSAQSGTGGKYPGEGGGLSNCGSVVSCIVVGNYPDQYDAVGSITYSLVEGGAPGLGNIYADPLFVSALTGDFSLQPQSPCIDAGDPHSEADPDGTVADMGAFPVGQFSNCEDAKVALLAGAPFDHIGSSLAASGPFVLAGLPSFDGPGFGSGAASLMYRDGGTWVELPQLVASDAAGGDLFGHSVAVDGGLVLVGARGASGEAGAAYIFGQQADGTWLEETKLEAADLVAGDWFGSRVAVEGNVAAVAALHSGALGTESGAVYVFRDSGGAWLEEAKLLAGDGQAGDQFGKGLAISGERILVGAYGDGDAGADSGSAYVFRDDAGTWVQEAKLTASDAASNALFGSEVALEDDVAVVAARGADGLGAAYVFRRSGTVWMQEQKLAASSPYAGAEFGDAIALLGDRILIGARMDDSAAPDGGAAYLFEFDGVLWIETEKFTLADAALNDLFGSAVALSGHYAMVGAEWGDDPELDSGELWALTLPGSCIPQITDVTPTSAQFPEEVTASGYFLDKTQTVLVEGLLATLVSTTGTSITYEPQPGPPGLVGLEAIGSDDTAEAVQQLFPSLEVSTTGIGGTVDAVLDNGDVGLYVLAFATGALPVPIPVAPPTWHGLLLDLSGPNYQIGTGAFATEDPVTLSYPVPDDSGFSGLTLYLQAWCQQEFFGPEVTYSFSNLASVTL